MISDGDLHCLHGSVKSKSEKKNESMCMREKTDVHTKMSINNC